MAGYILILIYFLFVEIAIVYAINIGREKLDQRKLINLYMATRVVKIILSLTFVGVYALVTKTDIRSFVLVFMSFYLLSIGFETWYFVRIERQLKAKNKKNELT